jgi:NAD(P)H dehydrogenase (quinone)
MSFNPVLREGFERVQPLEPDLQAAHDAIIFPLWLGGMPAILKGLLERVLQPDLVEPTKQKKIVRLLKGKSAQIMVTMGMPTFVYRWWFRTYASKLLRRNILGWMGVRPIHSTIFPSIESVSRRRREKWLKDAEKMGQLAA